MAVLICGLATLVGVWLWVTEIGNVHGLHGSEDN